MRRKKSKPKQKPIEAAGGIVMRGRVRPLFAVVQLSRQKTWALPKGKLNRGETAVAAARREAIEETGHDVEVHEFLGTLAYKSAGRPKTVRFWRMHASARPVAKLMRDVRAVRWLPLSQATARLTHEREKLFLEKIGRPLVRGMSSSRRRKPKSEAMSHKAAKPAPKRAAEAHLRVVAGRKVKLRLVPALETRPDAVPAEEVAAVPVFAGTVRKPPALMRKLWALLRRQAFRGPGEFK